MYICKGQSLIKEGQLRSDEARGGTGVLAGHWEVAGSEMTESNREIE